MAVLLGLMALLAVACGTAAGPAEESPEVALMRKEALPSSHLEVTADGQMEKTESAETVEDENEDGKHLPFHHHHKHSKQPEADEGGAVGGFLFGLVTGMLVAAGCLGCGWILHHVYGEQIRNRIQQFAVWLQKVSDGDQKQEEVPDKSRQSFRAQSAPPTSRYPSEYNTSKRLSRDLLPPTSARRGNSSSDSDTPDISVPSPRGKSTASSAAKTFGPAPVKQVKTLKFQDYHVDSDMGSTSASSHGRRSSRR